MTSSPCSPRDGIVPRCENYRKHRARRNGSVGDRRGTNERQRPERLSNWRGAHSRAIHTGEKKVWPRQRAIDVLRAAATAGEGDGQPLHTYRVRTHLVKSNNRCQLLFRARNSEGAIGHATGQPDKAESTPYNFLETNASAATGVTSFVLRGGQ